MIVIYEATEGGCHRMSIEHETEEEERNLAQCSAVHWDRVVWLDEAKTRCRPVQPRYEFAKTNFWFRRNGE